MKRCFRYRNPLKRSVDTVGRSVSVSEAWKVGTSPTFAHHCVYSVKRLTRPRGCGEWKGRGVMKPVTRRFLHISCTCTAWNRKQRFVRARRGHPRSWCAWRGRAQRRACTTGAFACTRWTRTAWTCTKR
jgi:hypothetical protein